MQLLEVLKCSMSRRVDQIQIEFWILFILRLCVLCMAIKFQAVCEWQLNCSCDFRSFHFSNWLHNCIGWILSNCLVLVCALQLCLSICIFSNHKYKINWSARGILWQKVYISYGCMALGGINIMKCTTQLHRC